jgi:hypothetical protein
MRTGTLLWLIACLLIVGLAARPSFAQETSDTAAAPNNAPAEVVIPDSAPGQAVVQDIPAEAEPATIAPDKPAVDPAPGPSAQPAAPPPATCGAPANPWGFTFCGGSVISSPPADLCSVFACIASFWRQTNGYVIQCRDGLLSHSGGARGSCSSHGGNSRPLYAPA